MPDPKPPHSSPSPASVPDESIQVRICRDESETVRLAEALAKAVTPGLVICLDGQLGAGKTRFVRAFASSLGVDESTINSPTYVIIQHYPGNLMVHHFDIYRLRDEDEWDELGAEDLLEGDGICLIEWASRFPKLFPEDRISIKIEATGTNERKFTIAGGGEKSKEMIRNWLKIV